MMLLLALTCAVAQGAPAAAPPKAPVNDTFAATFRTGPAWDAAKAPADQAGFAAHSQNLRALRSEGRLLSAAATARSASWCCAPRTSRKHARSSSGTRR